MTKFKKIAASVIAAATMAVTSTSAFAVSNYGGNGKIDYWNINYIFGAPSSESNQIADCQLFLFTGGYRSTCNNFNGYGDGYISVSVHGSEKWKITGTGTVPRNGWHADSSDADGIWVNFRFTAVGEHVTGSGSVQQL